MSTVKPAAALREKTGRPTRAEIQQFRQLEQQMRKNPNTQLSPADASLMRRMLKRAKEDYELETCTDIRIDCE